MLLHVVAEGKLANLTTFTKQNPLDISQTESLSPVPDKCRSTYDCHSMAAGPHVYVATLWQDQDSEISWNSQNLEV